MDDPTPTIYEWAGGREAFERWLNHFYDLIEEEAPDIAELFGGVVSEQHREHVTDWWSEVMGGPSRYTETRGGYEHMLSQHLNLGITVEQRLRFVTLLSRAADDVQLPDDPEFRAALLGYAEWGSRLALHNSQPGAAVVPHAPVPRWGWGVAPPYQPGKWRPAGPRRCALKSGPAVSLCRRWVRSDLDGECENSLRSSILGAGALGSVSPRPRVRQAERVELVLATVADARAEP